MAHQSAVDSMLALGRDIIAEPQTSAASGTLEQRLTTFIEDWSNLQLAWQNWFDELHARGEDARKLAEEVVSIGERLSGVEACLKGVFPASVGVEEVVGDMEALQVR